MADTWTILGTAGGLLGTVAVIVTTIYSLRSTSSRRHVERVQDASALLASLEALPKQNAEGRRLLVKQPDPQLKDELSRIVRENASSYALANPTPSGVEIARLLMPAYAVMFFAFSIAGLGHSLLMEDTTSKLVLAGGAIGFLVFAVFFGAAAIALYSRMSKRNRARELAGTPGRERYFEPGHEVYEAARSLIRRRRSGL